MTNCGQIMSLGAEIESLLKKKADIQSKMREWIDEEAKQTAQDQVAKSDSRKALLHAMPDFNRHEKKVPSWGFYNEFDDVLSEEITVFPSKK